MIEKNIYCDICKQRIKGTQLRYVMRRLLIDIVQELGGKVEVGP